MVSDKKTQAPLALKESKRVPEPEALNASDALSHGQSSHTADLSLPELSPTSRRLSQFGRRRKVFIAFVCGVLIGGLAGFFIGRFSAQSNIADSTTIEIASDLQVSGPGALSGRPLFEGVEMAISEANQQHLLPSRYMLKLISYDDTGKNNVYDSQKGVQNVKSAIANNLVAGIIGPSESSVAEAEMPWTNQAPIAQVSPDTTYPCLTKNVAIDPNCSGINDIESQMRPTGQLTYFRLATTDDIQGKAAADFLFTTKHYQRAILIEDKMDLYSYGIAQAFQQEWQDLGGQVIVQKLPEATSSEPDYQRTLQLLISTQPDLVYFAGDDPNGSYALQALSSIPELKKVAFAGSDGIIDNALLDSALTLHLSAPVYGSLPIADPAHSETVQGSAFQAEFVKNGYTDYSPYAASSYDSSMMLIEAIRTALQQGISTPRGAQDQVGAKKFRQAVLQALEQNHYTDGTGTTRNSYTGATGTQSFDNNGDTTNHTISFYQLGLVTPQPGWDWLAQLSGRTKITFLIKNNSII